MYIDINAMSLYLDLKIFQQDERFCSKLGMEVEDAKSHLKTSLSQILVICQLLAFVTVGQHRPHNCHKIAMSHSISQKLSYVVFTGQASTIYVKVRGRH